MVARVAGRSGRPYARARAIVLANSDTCWICGHSGARTADHVIPRKTCLDNGWLHLLDNPENMRPAHGSGNPADPNRCTVCGRLCNQSRGTGGNPDRTPRSRNW